MNILALLAFIIAFALFVVEAVKTKALVTWGFAALTLGLILVWVVKVAPDDLITWAL